MVISDSVKHAIKRDLQRLCDFWLKHGKCKNKHSFAKVCEYLEIEHHDRQQMWQYMKRRRKHESI